MAKPTKTKYYDDVVVVCTNGDYQYVLGMTMPELTIDVCGQSHPFYTGKETLIDTAGRIDRFAERLKKMQAQSGSGKNKNKKNRKFKQSLAELNQSNGPAAQDGDENKNQAPSRKTKTERAETQTV